MDHPRGLNNLRVPLIPILHTLKMVLPFAFVFYMDHHRAADIADCECGLGHMDTALLEAAAGGARLCACAEALDLSPERDFV